MVSTLTPLMPLPKVNDVDDNGTSDDDKNVEYTDYVDNKLDTDDNHHCDETDGVDDSWRQNPIKLRKRTLPSQQAARSGETTTTC